MRKRLALCLLAGLAVIVAISAWVYVQWWPRPAIKTVENVPEDGQSSGLGTSSTDSEVPGKTMPADGDSALGTSSSGSEAPKITLPTSQQGTPALGEEITAELREMNSTKYSKPPEQFRSGHVNARSWEGVTVKRTEEGFVIQLPFGAPIPTPTIYDGRLYVSGGFRSREYYCFDARSGEPIWAVSLSDDGPSSAACSDGIAVFNTESCTLFALDATNGKHLWSYWLGDPLTSTPAISDGIVITSYPARGHAVQAELGSTPPKMLPTCSSP